MMTLPLYYFAPIGTHIANKNIFARADSFPVNETHELVMVEAFHSPNERTTWEGLPGVEPLPHPLDTRPISPGHAMHLSAHGVAAGDRLFDALEKVGRKAPHFRL